MKKLFKRTLAIFFAALFTCSAGIAASAADFMTLEEFEEESLKAGNAFWSFAEEKIFPRRARYEMDDRIAEKYPQIQEFYEAWWGAREDEYYEQALWYLKTHYTEYLKAYAYELTIYVPRSVWMAVSIDTSPSFMFRQFMRYVLSVVVRIYLLPVRGFSKPLFII